MKHFFSLFLGILLLNIFPAKAIDVPDNFDIYLLIGQSNMAGRGTLEAEDTTTIVDGVWLLDSLGRPVEAIAPFNRFSTIRKEIKLQGVSPANNFGKLMHSRTGRPILLVVNARGGSAIGQWQPGDKHKFIDEAVRRTRQALKYGTLKGILWHQGETDVQKGTPDYAGKFKTMITALRDSLNASETPVIIGQLGRWEWAPMSDINRFNDSIVPTICRIVPNTSYVSSHDLKRLYPKKPSDPHFSRTAQLELGRRYADAMYPAVDSVYVTKFPGNKQSAISFTFDDGDLDHYLLVAPELEKRGFRGTFWVIGEKVDAANDTIRPRMTWSQLKEMNDHGHEISNHSWSHGKLVLMTPQEARREIEKNDSAIAANIGVKPVTFCYPFNGCPSWLITIAEEGRVGSRLRQTGIGQQNNKSTPESIKAWVDRTMATGDWGVTMTHGITTGYDMWYKPEQLWDMFDYIKANEDKIWVATFRDAAAYRMERDNVNITAERRGDKLIISTTCCLPSDLFNLPLTIAVKSADGKLRLIEMLPNDTKTI